MYTLCILIKVIIIIFTLNIIALTRRIKILIHNQSNILNDKYNYIYFFNLLDILLLF